MGKYFRINEKVIKMDFSYSQIYFYLNLSQSNHAFVLSMSEIVAEI